MIEPLESRVAPASVVVPYTDLDGDLVKIKASNNSSVAPPLDAGDLVFSGGATSGTLERLNLTDIGFAGASITFSVAKKPGGNGLADVGRIDATGIDLGNVTVKGDLGVLDAGSGGAKAVKVLSVRSMGAFGTATQSGNGDVQSDINGAMDALIVNGDFQNAFLRVAGNGSDGIGRIVIKGSIFGGVPASSGSIRVVGDVGSVSIGGDLVGGRGDDSGVISVFGELARVAVKGSIVGGSGACQDDFGGVITEGQIAASGLIGSVKIGRHVIGGAGLGSGQIRSETTIEKVVVAGSLIGGLGVGSGHIAVGILESNGSLENVRIGGDVIGGRGDYSGFVESFATIGNVVIGGSLIGGDGDFSGLVSAIREVGSVRIGGDVIGGNIGANEPVKVESGAIRSFAGAIGRVTIGGSLIAGTDNSAGGTLVNCGVIVAESNLGQLKIKGNVLGTVTPNGKTLALIGAVGSATPTNAAVSIGRIEIGGTVANALISAGVLGTVGYNGNAQIGPVFVGGDWNASSMTAGIRDAGGNGYATPEDEVVPSPSDDGLVARIVSVTIRGIVIGTQPGTDHYGFTAQQVGTFKVGSVKYAFTPATDPTIPLALLTSDVDVRER